MTALLLASTHGWTIGWSIGIAVVLAVVALVVPILLLAQRIGGEAADINDSLMNVAGRILPPSDVNASAENVEITVPVDIRGVRG